ncbi:hypothetical protein EG329_009396 [Mollisiaceae sp. DMI_Dod_QoI]|nr:hypothetical protein EG329_009396 [Helotiales sp. DMI_Dod_QoI]
MKSAFGSKRKARKIQVDDDEGETKDNKSSERVHTPSNASSNPNRKAFKKSSLRQNIAFDDAAQDGENEQETNRPTIGRSSSLVKKKKPAASRLSFGPGEIISGDAAEALEDDEAFTPKKPTLGRRVMEGNAIRRSLPYQSLPVRSNEDDDERPTYSKDYLNELKSSTPTTPKDLQALHATTEDEDMLDASELQGATVVDVDNYGASSSAAYIPTEAEIKEKKDRRARLAHEKDYISLDDDGDDRRQISLLPRKKEKETRLVREDEDLGEGFDEFVEDGKISLGKKAEREARKRQRKEMADMIHQAEGSSEAESDDSEAERRAAYEAAQTRAGMDGLHKPDEDLDRSTAQVPSRITPLPGLSECLERLQNTLSSMEQELAKRQRKLEESKQEKLDIVKREAEVQDLLKQAGARYAALKADTNGAIADPQALVDAQNSGLSLPLMADRGLESFGNTPVARPNVEDVG